MDRRRTTSALVPNLLVGLLAAHVCACSASASKSSDDLDSGAVNPDGGFLLDSGVANPEGGLLADTLTDSTGTPTGTAAVYGHSSDTLYRLDPTTLDVTEIGPFQDSSGGPLTQMTDIALDKDGAMFGVTFTDVYRIEYKTGAPKCTHLATLSTQFNGLTFVPAGTLDPAKEVLVGVANDGGWWRVDVSSGASATLTRLGSYGGGWASSGDSVGIIGDAVYSTVTQPFGGGNDHVVVVDPKTGAVKKDLGDTGVTGLFGVGYWGGVMYGFASNGSLYSIDLKTAKAKEIPLKTKPSGGWWGAGVTTSAPVSIH